MENKHTGRGFTLIELLVVVLIIGILAAVAVPQYQKAVLKSRVGTILPLLSLLRNAEEVYYLANGEYATKYEQLDVNLPCQILATDKGVHVCENDWIVDLLSGDDADGMRITAVYCPGTAATDAWNCILSWENRTLFITYWLRHSSKPNQIECQGTTSLGRSLCNSFQ